MKIQTLLLSDLHLGCRYSKAKELFKVLKKYEPNQIILNGDIIDIWELKRGGKINKDQMKIILYLLKLSYKIPIYYLIGNHEESKENLFGFNIGKIKISDTFDYIDLKRNLCHFQHGHNFDPINNQYLWLAKLGSIGYDIILWLNEKINKTRNYFGMPYISVSRYIKIMVKEAVMFISKYEDLVSNYAKSKQYNIIGVGHIHVPSITDINNVIVLNSGDFVESLSYIIETLDGEWKLKYYHNKLK